jgi:ATP-dependent Clp protease ATP-binding subunit ClpA
MRPDRALDALDEACAHLQARATYTPATQALIRERKRAGTEPRRSATEERQESGSAEELEEDPIEVFARDGIRALERFGAEIEAMLGVPKAQPEWRSESQPAPAPAPASAPPPAEATEPAPNPRRSASQIEAELARRLIEEGIVVRGHDVARVVGVASGYNVTWPS